MLFNLFLSLLTLSGIFAVLLLLLLMIFVAHGIGREIGFW